ncbi:copper homeostasis protein CutC [Silvibacterium sp.]|uniref:copper homeostasis protein CutC n=1 Tax=Silvibacterium sp. TaxID=1964179 RepID=UPI0039E402B4
MTVKQEIVFELCAESVEACVAAEQGGAHRIELCTALAVDGLTPSHGLTRVALDSCSLPIYVLVRPRAGDFVYSEAEFVTMKEDIAHLKAMGAAGFVIGVLHADGTVDKERTRELVELAAPLEVTFHRAFDATPSLEQALEDVIAVGCRRVLTSGGAPDVVTGAPMLAKLVEQAAGRTAIALGGGLRIDDAEWLAKVTKAPHYHGSLRQAEPAAVLAGGGENAEVASSGRGRSVVDPHDVRTMVAKLHNS